ncbi:MAG TPA: OmpH family outer membrane protein [Bryobacteraceae bacterium]|nr:OmpH family outer membrane protein [Bryobacteraceae bacterium]
MQLRLQWLLLPVLALQLAGTAAAQGPTKVGIININAAIASTKDGQKALTELETKFAPRKKELERKQQGIQGLQAQLQKGGTVLSEDQKRRLMTDIDSQTKSYNRDLQDASEELEQEQQKIFQELGGKMMAVIDKHAKEKGFALVIDVSSQQTPVLYAASEVDMTKDIIESYDKAGPAAAAPPATLTKPPAARPPATPPATKK